MLLKLEKNKRMEEDKIPTKILVNCEVPINVPIVFSVLECGNRLGYKIIKCEHKFIPHPRSDVRIFCEKCGTIRD